MISGKEFLVSTAQHNDYGQTLLYAPVHSPGEVGLELRTPPVHGAARIGTGEVAPPAVSTFLILTAPAGPGRVGGIVASQRQEEEPRRRVSFLHAGVRVRGGPRFRRVQPAE